MGPSARAIAEQASFQAFLHGYLQEIDPGHWLPANAFMTPAAVSPAHGCANCP